MLSKTNRWPAAALAAAVCVTLGAGGASAQDLPPGCVASNPNGAAAGALIGGVAGALFGNALSGRHKAPGTILGGVTGAMAGAAIGGNTGPVRCPDGYVYRVAPPPPGEAPVAVVDEGDVWYGAPPSVRERIVFMRHRVERLDRDGWLSPRETEGLFHRLSDIQHREEIVRRRNDGMLPPEVRADLGDQLNDVARHLRWKEYRSQHASE